MATSDFTETDRRIIADAIRRAREYNWLYLRTGWLLHRKARCDYMDRAREIVAMIHWERSATP